MYLLGYDIGTSSVKACLLDGETGAAVAAASSPSTEMPIDSPRPGWAEQNPAMWWDNVKLATANVLTESGVAAGDIKAIGITYQMHGLVCVDSAQRVLRPAILWCDSRAVEVGLHATDAIGPERCLKRLLNHVSNFTAAKLGWVKLNEPNIFEQIHKIMLPGDYIAMKLTGEVTTTRSGLSEGMMWDFISQEPARFAMDELGFTEDKLGRLVDTFSVQGELTATAAKEMGLAAKTPIAYRAGDQPNNAFSLNVLDPGQVAATAGTSGVIYGITAEPSWDEQSRVNSFAHVNNTPTQPRNGVLLCVNGTGILNSWLRANCASGMDYEKMNELASKAPLGADGLVVLPYGNGAERSLGNHEIGACIEGLNFNVHALPHLLRAGQEGIVFALRYGLDIMQGMGLKLQTVRAGAANMFLSDIFATAFASTTQATVELYDTDGAQGAARGAGAGCGMFKNFDEAFDGLQTVRTIEPQARLISQYEHAYARWRQVLDARLA